MSRKKKSYVEAFSPASISCIFVPVQHRNPDLVVSKGVRIALEQGMRVEVSTARRPQQLLHGRSIAVEPLDRALAALGNPAVRIEMFPDFSFSTGFGMSAGATIASALAINELLGLGLTRRDIATLAHRSEVQSGTGIGDVGAQLAGGVSAKFDVRSPLQVRRLRISPRELHVCSYGPIRTAKILGNSEQRAAIQRAGTRALKTIAPLNPLRLQRILEVSFQFANESGMLEDRRVKKSLDLVQANGGTGTMIMLGNALVATVPFPGSQVVQIGKKGARIL